MTPSSLSAYMYLYLRSTCILLRALLAVTIDRKNSPNQKVGITQQSRRTTETENKPSGTNIDVRLRPPSLYIVWL